MDIENEYRVDALVRVLAHHQGGEFASLVSSDANLSRVLRMIEQDPDDEEKLKMLRLALRQAVSRKPELLYELDRHLGVESLAAGAYETGAAAPSPPKKAARKRAAKPRTTEPPASGAETKQVTAILAASTQSTAVVGEPLKVTVDLRAAEGEEVDTGAKFSTDFPPGTHRLPLVVELSSNTVDLAVSRKPIVLRSDGTSEAPAVFHVTGKRAGKASITATLKRGGAWLASVKFELMVAAKPEEKESAPLVAVASAGTVRGAATVGGGASFNLVLLRLANGFHCVLTSPEAVMTADLPATPGDLSAAVLEVRDALVSMSHNDLYQQNIEIEQEVATDSLARLAEAGALLLRTLFFQDRQAHPKSAAIGDFLVKRLGAGAAGDWAAFGTQGYSVPWHAIYLDPQPGGGPVDPALFLGLTHIVEQLVIDAPRPAAKIEYRGKLSVGLHLDERIDAQQKLRVIAEQRAFWAQARKQSSRISLSENGTAEKALSKSLGKSSPHQLLYFLCHAGVAVGPDGQPAPNRSWLRLPDGSGQSVEITHMQLQGNSDTTAPLKHGPFVFINACESAQMSPEFYANFANYFLQRGARAVLGTECEIATVFAGEFARELFRAVLSGMALGEAVLHTRRSMLAKGNALGLAYGLHGEAGTYLDPAVLV